MLNLRNISAGYGNRQVLFDISFSVKKGQIVLLIGSNGSGKSTLLRCVCGLIPLLSGSTGSVHLNGEDITAIPTATLLKKGLIYIAQSNKLFETLTVRENLSMAGIRLSKSVLEGRLSAAWKAFPTLQSLQEQIPMKLSGGEKQLLTLAMAYLHRPSMILLDEPFAGLSPRTVQQVKDHILLLNRNEGVTFLIVEHRLKECLGIADRVVALRLGQLLREFEVTPEFSYEQLKPVFI